MSTEVENPPGGGHVPVPAVRKRRPRLGWLLLVGLALVGMALAVRLSPWAQEYPLKRASLPVLQSWALESPRDPLVHYYLGTAYSNAGTYPAALSEFQRAAALDPKMARAYTGIAAVQQRIGNLGDAYDAARKAVTLEPKSAEAQLVLAAIAYQGSKSQARLEFERLTKLAPKNADAWHWLGVCAEDLRDPNTAFPPLARAVELAPGN